MRRNSHQATERRGDEAGVQNPALRDREWIRVLNNTLGPGLALGLLLNVLPTWAAVPAVTPVRVDDVLYADAAVRPPEVSRRLARAPTKLRMPEDLAYLIELAPTRSAADDQNMNTSGGPVLDIGYLAPAPPEIVDSTPWIPVPDGGWVKRVELYSPEATALRTVMTDLGVLELRVYDPYGDAVFGPYRHPRLNDNGKFWSTVIFGDTIGLEFYFPPTESGDEPSPQRMPEITDIFHMYADFAGIFPQPEGCMMDISCQPSWQNSIEGRAVALLMQSTGCSGALLNRFPSDNAPILMTAQHCINNQTDANNLVVVWFWETATCGGAPPNFNDLDRNDGALLLKTHLDSDWTILGLYEPDQSGNYCGWSSGYWDDGSPAIGIHHPGGRVKSISFGTKVDDTDCSAIPSGEQWEVTWNSGATTGGSSGSPIFDSNRRVRGTLSCGNCLPQAGPGCGRQSMQDPCSPRGLYGRLDAAIGIIRWYITGMANPTYVSRDVGGDPGNQGHAERGTAALPFNTVYEGTFCVPADGIVRIKPGNYNERFTLWRPMRLEPSQAGIVRIGAP